MTYTFYGPHIVWIYIRGQMDLAELDQYMEE